MSESTPQWADYTEPSYLDVGGIRVAYRRKGSGQPLLFLHGAGLTRRWFPLYEYLAQGFDVIVAEHPGFGDTELPEWLTEFDDLVIHYAQLLDALGFQQAHIAGHSFGAWIAAELAAFYPERLLSLSLIAPGGLRPDPSEPMRDMFRMSPEEGMDALLGSDADRWADYLDEGDPGAQMVQDYREATALARVSWNPRYDLKLERRLSRVRCPAQVIVPDEERLIPPSVAKKYAELIPGATFVTVSGDSVPTQHLLIIQEPKRLAEQVASIATAGERA